MTFKDLKKRVSLIEATQQSKLFDGLCNKPFWIWDQQQHRLEDSRTNGDCCFNHIIGLPTKQGIEKAIFDYEKILHHAILDNDNNFNILHHAFKHKHV